MTAYNPLSLNHVTSRQEDNEVRDVLVQASDDFLASQKRVEISLDALLDPRIRDIFLDDEIQHAIYIAEEAVRDTLRIKSLETVPGCPRHTDFPDMACDDCLEIQHRAEEYSIKAARSGGRFSPVYKEMADYLYTEALKEIASKTRVRGDAVPVAAARIVDEFLGAGPIEPMMRDPEVTEVMVNNSRDIFYEKKGKKYHVEAVRFRNPAHLQNKIERLLIDTDKACTNATPCVDAQLLDGSRVNATHESVSDGDFTLCIRRFPLKTWTLFDLVELGSVSMEMACDLARIVRGKASLMMVGGTSSGKTSCLNALSGCIGLSERVITVEDSRELRLHPLAKNIIHHEVRRGGKAADAVTMQTLVKNALREAPDRIVVGETRGSEVFDYINACMTGHEGSMSTIHANSPREVITRIQMMMKQAGFGFSPEDIEELIGIAVDVVVFAKKFPDGTRRISDISELVYDPDTRRVTVNQLWAWDQQQNQHVKLNEVSPGLAARIQDFSPVPILPEEVEGIAIAARKADKERLDLIKQGR